MFKVHFNFFESSLRTRHKFSLFLEVDFEQDKNTGSSLLEFQKFISYTMEVLFIFESLDVDKRKFTSGPREVQKGFENSRPIYIGLLF
jgi:hypothetical protein